MPKKALHALVTSAVHTNYLRRYLRLLVVEFFIDGLPTEMIPQSDYKNLTSKVRVNS
jgi:hypothetical protein